MRVIQGPGAENGPVWRQNIPSIGKFQKGKVASFEGFWDEFPKFVAEDKWAPSYSHRLPRAATWLPPTHNM